MQFLTSGFLSNSDPRQESVGRIGTRQGRGPAYLGPRVPSDQALQDQGVALPDGVDPLADIILLHHTGLPCVHDLGLGWSCGERTEKRVGETHRAQGLGLPLCVWGRVQTSPLVGQDRFWAKGRIRRPRDLGKRWWAPCVLFSEEKVRWGGDGRCSAHQARQT